MSRVFENDIADFDLSLAAGFVITRDKDWDKDKLIHEMDDVYRVSAILFDGSLVSLFGSPDLKAAVKYKYDLRVAWKAYLESIK